MKKVVLLCLLSYHLSLSAQSTYSISTIPYNPDPFVGGTPSGATMDDMFSDVIYLPFGFCFYDGTYNSLLIGSNGYITFDTTDALSYCLWPISAAAPGPQSDNKSIFAPWQDINPAQGGSITYAINGIAPYRRFVVSYYQVPMYSCVGLLFSEQIILYETTNVIEIHVQNKPICPSWNGGNAILGLEFNDTTAAIVPGHNYPTQWSTANESWRFTPGGSPCQGPPQPCTVSGKVFADNNANCIFDGGDAAIVNRSVLVNGGAYYAWTDNNGDYSVALDTGNWVVTEVIPPYYGPQCPVGGAYNIALTTPGQISANNHFADSVLFHCSDLIADLGTPNFTRCGNEFAYINYCNQGTEPDTNVSIVLSLNDSLILDSASLNYTQVGNEYTFSAGNLNPGQCGIIQLLLSVGCDTVGTVYCMDVEIDGNATNECDTLNNQNSDCHALIASYDPNTKHVASQDFSSHGWVTDEMIHSTDGLSYMVTFQNTGNDTAFNVEIRDTLSAFLDPTTLVPGAASALYNWTRVGNVVIFQFNNIQLPDSNTNEPASHGFVKFRIDQVSGNPDGTMIDNHAAIYFDQNPPVITTMTHNLICDNPPVAANGIVVSPAEYCIGDVVTLSVDGGNAGSNGEWLWMEGGCSNGASAGTGDSISFTVSGGTSISVYASSICGESSCTEISINPTATPVASFTYIDNNGSVSFTDGSSGASTWAWDFGDGNTSTLQNPVHNYTSSGIYTVVLTVTNLCGTQTFSQQVNVTVTSLADALMAEVKIFPNPVQGTLFIRIPEQAGQVEASLLDVTGKVRLTQTLGGTENQIQLNVAKGFYLLQLKGNEFSMRAPVVVE